MTEIPLYRPLTVLVDKYFGRYLDQLVSAHREKGYANPYFINFAFLPDGLESRLSRLEGLNLTSGIVKEIGKIQYAAELDRRLTDAWAELRALDQLQSEGFGNIRKVTETADFIAQCGEEEWAFQVIRINKNLRSLISREQTHTHEDTRTFYYETYGPLSDIYSTERGWLRAEGPLSGLFWDAVRFKNGNFSRWKDKPYRRCIIIVTIDTWFETDFEQRLAAYLIRHAIHDEGLGKINFEDLLWLPNLGNGMWFVIGKTLKETECFGTPDSIPNSWDEAKLRQENYRSKIHLDIDPENEYIAFVDQWRRICL